MTTTASLHNNRLELILTDRGQAIDLAKIICPEYNKHDEYWIAVTDLSNSINNVKKDMKDCFKELALLTLTESESTKLAYSFLSSVTKSKLSAKHGAPTIDEIRNKKY